MQALAPTHGIRKQLATHTHGECRGSGQMPLAQVEAPSRVRGDPWTEVAGKLRGGASEARVGVGEGGGGSGGSGLAGCGSGDGGAGEGWRMGG